MFPPFSERDNSISVTFFLGGIVENSYSLSGNFSPLNTIFDQIDSVHQRLRSCGRDCIVATAPGVQVSGPRYAIYFGPHTVEIRQTLSNYVEVLSYDLSSRTLLQDGREVATRYCYYVLDILKRLLLDVRDGRAKWFRVGA
ncbi:hypothetical protein EBR96_02150 [bacterium]|nr:hypothetical protein [bacterium]